MARKRNYYSKNATILKVANFFCILQSLKPLQDGHFGLKLKLKLKLPKTREKQLYNHITVVSFKKQLEKEANIRKITSFSKVVNIG